MEDETEWFFQMFTAQKEKKSKIAGNNDNEFNYQKGDFFSSISRFALSIYNVRRKNSVYSPLNLLIL